MGYTLVVKGREGDILKMSKGLREKLLIGATLSALTLNLQYLAPAAVLASEHESEEQAVEKKNAPLVLKGGAVYSVPRGTSIKLKLASVPTNGMRLLDKDLEGNPLPAHVGDVITARTTEDIYVDDNKVIPEGTEFKGRVSKVLPPRRVQRPGWLEISFTELATPDGRRFAFRAEANNFKKATMKGAAKATGMVAANAAGGAIVGVLCAYQIFGMKGTAATHGYNLAGGAAVGALAAAGYAIMKRGAHASLEPGDDLNLSMDCDLAMPALSEPTKKVSQNDDGITVDVEKTKVVKDGLGGHFIMVSLNIENNSGRTLDAIDLYLRDTNGNKFPVSMGPDEESEFLFKLEPYTSLNTKLYFNVDYPKLKHELYWLDHKTRRVCFRQKL